METANCDLSIVKQQLKEQLKQLSDDIRQSWKYSMNPTTACSASSSNSGKALSHWNRRRHHFI